MGAQEIDTEREYTYAELCRMTKKRVIRIAGYQNIKSALKDGINKNITMVGDKPMVSYDKLTKKYLARIMASDR